MNYIKYIIFITSIIALSGCTKQYIPIRYKCLPEPVMESVKVQEGTIDKDNVLKVLNNHIKLWEYIEYLKIKGCHK